MDISKGRAAAARVRATLVVDPAHRLVVPLVELPARARHLQLRRNHGLRRSGHRDLRTDGDVFIESARGRHPLDRKIALAGDLELPRLKRACGERSRTLQEQLARRRIVEADRAADAHRLKPQRKVASFARRHLHPVDAPLVVVDIVAATEVEPARRRRLHALAHVQSVHIDPAARHVVENQRVVDVGRIAAVRTGSHATVAPGPAGAARRE